MTSYTTTFHVSIEARDEENARAIAHFLGEMLLDEGCDPVRGGVVREGRMILDGDEVSPVDLGHPLVVEFNDARYVFDSGELT